MEEGEGGERGRARCQMVTPVAPAAVLMSGVFSTENARERGEVKLSIPSVQVQQSCLFSVLFSFYLHQLRTQSVGRYAGS